MNDFVDYGKRGVELPEGCVNLFDVLCLGTQRVTASYNSPTEAVAHVEEFALRFLESRAKTRMLLISCSERASAVILHYGNNRFITMVILHPSDTIWEQAVRRVFDKANLSRIDDSAIAGLGFPFVHEYVLPTVPHEVIHLAGELLLTVFGSAGESKFRFEYREKNA